MAQRISEGEVEKVAGLARLHLSSREAELYTGQLGEVLNFVSQLPSEGEQGDIKQSAQTLDDLRKDEIKPCEINQQKLLSNAPAVENGSIKVPAVFSNGLRDSSEVSTGSSEVKDASVSRNDNYNAK